MTPALASPIDPPPARELNVSCVGETQILIQNTT